MVKRLSIFSPLKKNLQLKQEIIVLKIENGRYRSPESRVSIIARFFPTAVFYFHFLGIILRAGWLAKRGKYDDATWVASSRDVLRRLESIGVKVEVSGLEHLEGRDSPVVFIGNHMSMMETLLLPGFIRQFIPVTFIIKESLLHYPVFKYVMRSRNPIAVTRTNPRKDLTTVFTEGKDRLTAGISVIVFPQTTRQLAFDPKQMSSIGTKLAQKAGTAIIPVALKTDAWNNGKWLKDFGTISPRKKARFAFGAPIPPGEENRQETTIRFISKKLQAWQQQEAGGEGS